MSKKIFPLLIVFVFSSLLFAQDKYYTPLNIKSAFNKNTRSLDGKPGNSYWQNRSDYILKAEYNPRTKLLTGHAEIKYHNNSPDTIKQITIRLYQDIYKKGNTRDFALDPRSLNDGVKVSNQKLDNESIPIANINRRGTNLFYNLLNPLNPKSEVNISLDWEFNMPIYSGVRMGTYDSVSAFVAYWYPQVSVYDDIDGWDNLNYTGQVEFYNDFGDFDVELTVPKGFVVWATGVLQNPESVLAPAIYEKYKKANQSDSIYHIIKKEDYKNLVTSDNENNVWKFKADYVPDFAFATSNHYLWDGSSIIVDNKTGRKTFVDAAYNSNSKDFPLVANIARTTVDMLSNDLPGYPFPYPKITIFNGDGGMEFPMMVNDGSADGKAGTVHLTSHEISHTYFPFFMGTNERKYAWMDEGWATLLPSRIQSKLAPGYDPISRNAQQYNEFAGSEGDIAPIVPSFLLNGASYRTASYRRPGEAYNILCELLGEETFKKALNEYISRWNGKHPIPNDFFNTFDNVTGEDLSWFWKPWFFESGYPDLAVTSVIRNEKEQKVIIENKGTMPIPIELKVTFDDGTTETKTQSPAVWKNGMKKYEALFNTSKIIKSVELGSTKYSDTDLKNNSLKAN
ncbi:MAG: M1 family metallopeptidase [Melioribacteraceae bacterium]|nr:M1 family metallopeptidase [Melioribacteraceae bacterium]